MRPKDLSINTHSHQEAATFNNPRAARAFSDYLITQSIRNKVVDTPQGSSVVLLDDGERQHFYAELQAFLQHPEDERYLAASWQASEERKGDADEPSSAALSSWYSRKRYRLRGRKSGPLTIAVILACAAVFVELNLGDPLSWWPQLRFFSSWGFLLESGHWWRWITPSLTHVQIIHIAFNVLWWWDLGSNIERRQGTIRLLTLFILLNFVSNLAQFIVSGPNFMGLSGVVYGVLGYLWAYVKMCPAYPEPVSDTLFRVMVIWLVVCFTGVMDVLVQGAIAHAAHVGGLLGGMMLGFYFGWVDRKV